MTKSICIDMNRNTAGFPAEAGIQVAAPQLFKKNWIPAFSGMTVGTGFQPSLK